MEAMRQSWSDDRLDDLNKRVDDGFARVETRIERLDARIDIKIDASSHELRLEMRAGFDQVNARFDRMQQTMIRGGVGLIGVLIASSAGLIATQL